MDLWKFCNESWSTTPRKNKCASCWIWLLYLYALSTATKKENKNANRYFGIKEVHRIEGAVPSLGSDMLLYNANNGKLLALVDCDWITTMRTGAVAAVSAKALRKTNAHVYGFVGLGNTARATMLCVLEAEPEKHFDVKLLRYKNQAELFIERFKTMIMCRSKSWMTSTKWLVQLMCFSVASPVQTDCLLRTKNISTRGNSYTCSYERITKLWCHFWPCFGDDTDHVKGFKFFPQFNDYNEIGEVLAGRDPGRKSEEQG